MSEIPRRLDDDETEDEALAAAIAVSESDPVTMSHEEVRARLLRVARGEFYAPLPLPL